MKRPQRVAGVLTLLLTFAALIPPTSATAFAAAPTGVSWQSAGDSYSSGEGVFGNEGACAQSRDAYGPKAAGLLRGRGWGITNETFTACTGHLVEDFFNARSTGGQGLWSWGRQQGGPERVDVITMSFGGNDIGFADLIADCLTVWPDSWVGFIPSPLTLASNLSGCDTGEEVLKTRIDRLLDPTAECNGRRGDDAVRALKLRTDGFDCNLALDGRRGSLIAFYYDLVTKHLTDRGRLYIVGYPRIFADVNQWPKWIKVACESVPRGDTEKLGRVAEYFNNRLQEAVGRANQAIGSERLVFVDRFALYRDGLHELCGTNDDWLNGIAFDRDSGFELRKQTSFHPNAAGHAATAARLVDQVDASFPRPQPARAALPKDVKNMRLPAGVCEPDAPSVTLRDGSANNSSEGAAERDGSPEFSVTVKDATDVVRADLTGDGVVDLAFVASCEGYGGTNNWYLHVVVMTTRGSEVALLGDLTPDSHGGGVGTASLELVNGQLRSGDGVYVPGDPRCCPSGKGYTQWRWDGSRFVQAESSP